MTASSDNSGDGTLGRIALKQVRVSRQELEARQASQPPSGGAPRSKGKANPMNRLVPYLDLFCRLEDEELSRLAREELRHFEQVIAILRRRDIAYTGVSASRYASEMRELVRRNEPDRLVDTLLIGAIIEARSCERFAALAPYLDEELSAFYRSLLKSEARHFQDYLSLAEEASAGAPLADRRGELLAAEALLVQSTDTELRFHSGVPVVPLPAG